MACSNSRRPVQIAIERQVRRRVPNCASAGGERSPRAIAPSPVGKPPRHGSSSVSRPASTARIASVVVAMTLVSDARSKIVSRRRQRRVGIERERSDRCGPARAVVTADFDARGGERVGLDRLAEDRPRRRQNRRASRLRDGSSESSSATTLVTAAPVSAYQVNAYALVDQAHASSAAPAAMPPSIAPLRTGS